MQEIKNIELIFENCEIMKFNKNEIGEFSISQTSAVVSRKACNSISKHLEANSVVIELYKVGDLSYQPFGVEDESWAENKFKRIEKYNDIVAIGINYEDNTSETYYVNYDSESDIVGAPNKNQKTYISKFENLYIVIEEDKDVFDYFDEEKINDIETVEFNKKCLDIGIEPQYPNEYNEDNLPEMYRHVILKQGNLESIAVRIYDQTNGWKFIFAPNHTILHFPEAYTYLRSNIEKRINSGKAFSIDKIKNENPLPENPPQDDYLLDCYLEAKHAFE